MRYAAIVALALVACGREPEATPPPAVPAASKSAPAAQLTSADLARARGTAGPFLRAAQSLALDPKARDAVEQVAARLSSRVAFDRAAAAAGAVLEEIRPQILAGTIELAKLEARLDAVAKTAQAREDEQAKALDDLHAALAPKERNAVADAVAAAVADVRKNGRIPRHIPPNERAAAVAERLELDATQREKLEKAFAANDHDDESKDLATASERIEATIAAFRKDAFEAKTLAIYARAGEEAREVVVRNLDELARITPILNEAQRKKLAERMR
jgi:hypothetical protein